MSDVDFESSHMQLLTEALRAGPGSPEWRAALVELGPGAGNGSGGGDDEYQLLYAARERLASGHRYREVRPGAGFTRKVFDAIEQEDAAPTRAPASANLIAAASALVILGVLAVVAYFVMPRGAGAPPQDLAETYFVETLASSNFDGQLGMQWASFGSLQVEARDGLRPVLAAAAETYRGGGAMYERPLPPQQPFAAEATLRIPRGAGDDVVVQAFVTDDPNFAGDSATSERELAFLVRGGEASVVLPGGRIAAQGIRVPTGRSPAEVRITVNQTEAAVALNGRKVWSGPHGFDGVKSRLVGVRLLARKPAGAAASADPKSPPATPFIESVRILVPQQPPQQTKR